MSSAACRIAAIAAVAIICAAIPASATGRPSFISRHQIEGEVQQIDRKAGALTIATRAGTVRLGAPLGPAAHLAKGTEVALGLAIFRGTPPPAEPQPGDASLFRRRVNAEVTRVDPASGLVYLAWAGSSPLRIDVPAQTLQSLKKGDRLPVELTVDLALSPAASARTGADLQRRGALATFLMGILGKK